MRIQLQILPFRELHVGRSDLTTFFVSPSMYPFIIFFRRYHTSSWAGSSPIGRGHSVLSKYGDILQQLEPGGPPQDLGKGLELSVLFGEEKIEISC